MKEFIVIPAYNEEKKIGNVIREVKNYSPNIIVIDDGSKDNTYQIAQEQGVKVIKHSINLGKGAAAKTGCDYALQCGAGRMVVIDSDGQHEAKDIPRFLENLNDVDIVYGYRQSPQAMPAILRFGNWFISKTVSLLYKVNLKDTQCGYRAFTAEAYHKMRWQASCYCMESEMIANAGKNGLNYKQIPIQTIYSDKYKGTTVFDGVKIVFKMFAWRLFK